MRCLSRRWWNCRNFSSFAAARQGVKVILSEQEWMLGGLATAGLVTVFLPLCDGKGTQHIFGIGEELLRLSIKYGHEDRYPDAWLDAEDVEKRKKQRFLVQFNPQLFAVAAEQLLLDNGVKILYGTKVLDVYKEDESIHSVMINNREGTSAIKVKSVADCTGEHIVWMKVKRERNLLTALDELRTGENRDLYFLFLTDAFMVRPKTC